MVRPKATKSNAGAISRDKYVSGDFVSMDQYVVKELGRLPTGFGREADHSMFHGGTILCDAAVKHYHSDNGVFIADTFTSSCKERRVVLDL